MLEHWHHVMHIFVCLKNIMLPAIFVYNPSLGKKFSKFVLVLFFCCYSVIVLFIRLGAASSNLTQVCLYANIVCRVTLRRVFSLSVGLVYHIDYVPLQTRYINNIITNISTASTGTYLVFVARAEVFKQVSYGYYVNKFS